MSARCLAGSELAVSRSHVSLRRSLGLPRSARPPADRLPVRTFRRSDRRALRPGGALRRFLHAGQGLRADRGGKMKTVRWLPVLLLLAACAGTRWERANTPPDIADRDDMDCQRWARLEASNRASGFYDGPVYSQHSV